MKQTVPASTVRSPRNTKMSFFPGIRSLGVTLAVLALLVLTAASSGAEPESLENYARFGPDGSETTDFQSVNGVAVDQGTGNVFVLDGKAGALYKFEAGGSPLAWGGSAGYISGNRIDGLAPFTLRAEAEVAVDSTSHVVYVTEKNGVRAFEEDGEPAEFTAGPGVGTNEIPSGDEVLGVAVDQNQAIYVSEYGGTISIYSASGEAVTSVPVAKATNIAVDAEGTLYIIPQPGRGSGGERVEKLIPSEFPVSGSTSYTAAASIETEGLAVGLGVDTSTGHLYVIKTSFAASWLEEFDKAGAFLGSFAKPEQEAPLANFAQGVAPVAGGEAVQFYVGNFQAFTSSKNYPEGYGKVEIFGEEIVEGPPEITSTSVTGVTANSAILLAKVNPHTFDTTYHFEYGFADCEISTCTIVPLGGATIGSGHRAVSVSQLISTLQVETTYHYRVVAENSEGTTKGGDHTFRTQSSALGFALSDNRAWELVSPPNKHGSRVLGSDKGLVQAAADGQGLVYPSIGSIESEPAGNRIGEGSMVLAHREVGGWHSRDITPPNAQVTPGAVGQNGEYRLFTDQLEKAVLQPWSGTPLSPEASERTPYLRDNTEPPVYTPLVTGKEGYANVPDGIEFGGENFIGNVFMAGANAELTHIVLSSSVPLVDEPVIGEGNSLYEWVAGQLEPVSVLPSGEGGTIVANGVLGSGNGLIHNAVSHDGRRVFWETGSYSGTSNSLTALYLSEPEAARTVRLDLGQPGATEAGEAHPVFQGAGADGTVVFFTDSQQLTEDASPDGIDLYRCVLPLNEAVSGCATLTDLSAPRQNAAESAEVKSVIAGMGEDGGSVYFVAEGVLDNTANEFGDSAVAGEANLYAWKLGGGARYVATLSPADSRNWGVRDKAKFGEERWLIATASPNGRYLSFMSERSLTGYDNRDSKTDEPVQEIFRYDATEDRLDCVSCNPTGSRPSGQVAGSGLFAATDPVGAWVGVRLAAILPEPTLPGISGASHYHPRAVLDNGRVFFNAYDSLVPADSNGQWDVYQYEPDGLGDCTSSVGASVTSVGDACVSLISSGTANEEAGFIDASESGNDVFFLSPAQLNEPDEDHEYDVYDARVNGVPATLPNRTECIEACRSVAQPPNVSNPGSWLFSGWGNQKPTGKRCPRGKKKVKRNGKIRCIKKKHPNKHRHNGKATR